MTLDEADKGSSESSGPTAHRRRKGRWEDPREAAEASGWTPPRQ